MKLFSLVASALGLAYAAEEVAEVPEVADAFQTASTADKNIWKNDVLHAASTTKQIKNKSCKLPKGKSLKQLGTPSQVSKHYYRLSNGNTRATYQFKFKDGTMVYAGNSNVGQKGGNWRVYCFRQGHNRVTQGPHSHDLSSSMTSRLRGIFKNIDKDGSGTITTGGAYTGLSQVFPSYSLPNFEATLEKESIRAAGKDKVVDLDEFECVAKKLYNIKTVYDEFRQYDKNHDKKIGRNELEGALMQFYFKKVAKPGMKQTPAVKAYVKTMVDKIIKAHDKNHDQQVSWQEFEMDAFMEEHYKPNAKCQTSKTPLNKHEIGVVENLIKKFHGNTKTKQMSHSMWYQITSMLTEQAIDAVNGPQKGPALGCYHKKPTNNNQHNNNQHNNNQQHHGGFGQNGGKNWGNDRKQNGPSPGPQNGPIRLGGRRVLLDRMLQQREQRGPSGQQRQSGGVDQKTRMTVMQAVQALHKQADKNHDGRISDHEILDIFQGVRNHLGASNFGTFLDMVNKLHGPINCSKNHDCGKCTDVKNAGLCGWFGESQHNYNNPFGGYQAKKSKGTCKFVDRSNSAEQNQDQYRLSTCVNQCHSKNNQHGGRGNQNGGRGGQNGGRGGQNGGRGNQNGGRGNFRQMNGR